MVPSAGYGLVPVWPPMAERMPAFSSAWSSCCSGPVSSAAISRALTRKLSAEGCARLWLTMTNANLSALQFYLRRGFRLSRVRPGGVDNARKLKA